MRFCSLCSHGHALLVTEDGVAACLSCAARAVNEWCRFHRGVVPPRPPPPEAPPAEDAAAEPAEALPEKVSDWTSRGKF